MAWAYGSGWQGDWCQDVAQGENTGSAGDTDVDGGGDVDGDGDVNEYWDLDWDVDLDVDGHVAVDVNVNADECEEDGMERKLELEHDVSRSTR